MCVCRKNLWQFRLKIFKLTCFSVVSLQEDVPVQQSPAALVLRSVPALLSGASWWTTHWCSEQQNVSFIYSLFHLNSTRLCSSNQRTDHCFLSLIFDMLRAETLETSPSLQTIKLLLKSPKTFHSLIRNFNTVSSSLVKFIYWNTKTFFSLNYNFILKNITTLF